MGDDRMIQPSRKTRPLRLPRVCALAAALALAPAALAALEDVDIALRGGPAEPEARAALEETLRGASLLVSLTEGPELTSRDIVAAARSDYTRLVEALFSQGYYSTVVRISLDGREAAGISPLSVPGTIGDVDITVDPGPRFVFGQARVAPVPEDTALPPGFAPGQTANAALVRQAAQAGVSAWQAIGYPKADVGSQRITARHRDAELDVALSVDPGPRLRFGDTEVSGESRVRPARVRQIAGFPKGALYSPEAVEEAGRRLRRTGTFRSVEIAEGPALPDGTLDMSVVVVDREPRRIGGGAEISSDNGLTLTGFWLHRNILGGAESLRIEGEARQLAGVESGADYRLKARFERTAVFGADTLFFTEAELAYYDEPDYELRGGRVAAGFSREVTDALTAETGLSVSFAEVTDRYLPGEPTRELLLVSAPNALTYDIRDDELDATEGLYLRVEAEPFVETRAPETGLRLGADLRTYTPLGGSERFVLANRLQLGMLTGPDAADAPPDFLYYSGGGGTVRGQPYNSLDVDYDNGRLGGRSFLGAALEMRFGVTDALGGVVFYDAGLLSGESTFEDPVGHAGAGVGVRYRTPIGPIRFDVAAPVVGDTGDGVQIYIGIGQAF
jgi:translocation and assembly module TamA